TNRQRAFARVCGIIRSDAHRGAYPIRVPSVNAGIKRPTLRKHGRPIIDVGMNALAANHPILLAIDESQRSADIHESSGRDREMGAERLVL
ncbi:MAG: hypothetical protein P8182_09875, partial [Deltaproteobacteria bacterium]